MWAALQTHAKKKSNGPLKATKHSSFLLNVAGEIMQFNVNKSTIIDAPLANVRKLIEHFNHWSRWSPWVVIEPTCTVTVTGTANEPGHSMSWDGEIIGSGNITLESSEAHQLNYQLEFLKPWKSKANTSFLLEEISGTDGQTKVTWTMNSSLPFFLFFMVKTMKNAIGMDYQRGLRMLKEISEKERIPCDTINNGIVEYKGFSYVGIQRTAAMDDMPAMMEKDFEQLVNDIVVKAQKGAKHWVCIYPKFDMKNQQGTYIVAVSNEDLADLELGSSYIKGNIDDSRALEIKHNGAYDFLGNAWSMGMMTMQAKKMKGKGFPFEQYWNSPLEAAPHELKTSIYFPVK